MTYSEVVAGWGGVGHEWDVRQRADRNTAREDADSRRSAAGPEAPGAAAACASLVSLHPFASARARAVIVGTVSVLACDHAAPLVSPRLTLSACFVGGCASLARAPRALRAPTRPAPPLAGSPNRSFGATAPLASILCSCLFGRVSSSRTHSSRSASRASTRSRRSAR